MQRFIDAKLAQTPPIVKTWYDEKTLRELAAEALTDDIERLTSDRLAKLFYLHAQVDGVDSHEAYKTRIIGLPELGDTICGIRFRGMDVTKPFVNMAITEQPLTANGMAESVAILAEAFVEFSPQQVRFYLTSNLNIATSDFVDGVAQWDRALLANRFAALTPMAHVPDEFSVKRAQTVDFYDDYAQMCTRLFAESPKFLHYTRCESKDDFQNILDSDGHHFVLSHAGEFTGLISLDNDKYGGLQGLYVVEKILAPHMHGQGLGKAFEATVIRRLLDDGLVSDDEIFFGEIDYDNKGSLHSALKNGRVEVGRFLWLEV